MTETQEIAAKEGFTLSEKLKNIKIIDSSYIGKLVCWMDSKIHWEIGTLQFIDNEYGFVLDSMGFSKFKIPLIKLVTPENVPTVQEFYALFS